MDNKKRKKKSFLKKTIKYAKRGSYGQGTHINDETFNYFLHILKVQVDDFETDEEKEIFAENAFEQLLGHEIDYSCNQVVSVVVEKLLTIISDKTLTKFMQEFDNDLRRVCNDPYGSFVLQKLVIVCTKRLATELRKDDNSKDKDSQLINVYRNWILKISKFVMNNLEYFLHDNHANPVIRTVLACLAGLPDLNVRKIDTKFNEVIKLEHPIYDEFTNLFKDYIDRLMILPNFAELASNNMTSGLLQVALLTTSLVDKKLLKRMCNIVINRCFIPNLSYPENIEEDNKKELKMDVSDNRVLLHIFENDSYLRLLEVVTSLARHKLWTKIYANVFFNNLPILSVHNKANYSVQKLVTYCHEKEEFDEIFDRLIPCLSEVFKMRYTGVILALCEGCKKFKTKQSQFMKHWIDCVKCNDDQSASKIVLSTVCLLEKDHISTDNNNSSFKVELHGSLLVQNMLHFNKPIKIVNSVLEMEENGLISVLCDPKGSYIADAYYSSEYIGEKNKENFIKKLTGSYATLCCSKNGSRVFDIVWKAAKLKLKILIMTELCEKQSQLESNQYGKCIARNIALATFRHRKEDWVANQNKETKIDDLFADLL